jgi:signal transduction histidine kinase
MDRIFDRFVRTPQSLTTPVRGTGLGLWICREYVEAMGGNIWVDSTIGRGSDFQFCLPETAPPQTP